MDVGCCTFWEATAYLSLLIERECFVLLPSSLQEIEKSADIIVQDPLTEERGGWREGGRARRTEGGRESEEDGGREGE
ncbi:hypothetical protein IRJ41_006910 [Triplophysa rosa]|uniref:Uncharacterized protein n=1 Tax=Triplophysa rosa TaxID=992332 RepID=A0A9W8C3M1_TRIRA|nr:hypothetical protein IRJ41_006910 [Triplophysa rosa]